MTRSPTAASTRVFPDFFRVIWAFTRAPIPSESTWSTSERSITNPGVVTSCSLVLKDWTLLLSSGPLSLRVDTFPVGSGCATLVRVSSMVGDYIAADCGESALSVVVTSDHAVADGDHAVRVLGDVVLVSNHDD